MYGKTDQHRSIYNSYNGEVASTMIKSIQLENTSDTYSSFNSVKFDTSNAHDKFLLYSQFVVWYCKGSSIAPLSDYPHNPTFQELPTMSQYFTNTDEKVFIDLTCRKGYMNELEKIAIAIYQLQSHLRQRQQKKWDCGWLDTIKVNIYTHFLTKES